MMPTQESAERTLPERPTFGGLCEYYQLDYAALLEISTKAKVAKSIVDAMSVGSPVERPYAEAVLIALSAHAGQPYTLLNTTIPLLFEEEEYLPARYPSLFDLWQRHHFDVARLARDAQVEVEVVQKMLGYCRVERAIAERVIAALATLVKYPYTSEMVYLPDV